MRINCSLKVLYHTDFSITFETRDLNFWILHLKVTLPRCSYWNVSSSTCEVACLPICMYKEDRSIVSSELFIQIHLKKMSFNNDYNHTWHSYIATKEISEKIKKFNPFKQLTLALKMCASFFSLTYLHNWYNEADRHLQVDY